MKLLRGLLACIVLGAAVFVVAQSGQATPSTQLAKQSGEPMLILVKDKSEDGDAVVKKGKLKRIPGTCTVFEKGSQGGGGCKAPAKFKCDKTKNGDRVCCCYGPQ